MLRIRTPLLSSEKRIFVNIAGTWKQATAFVNIAGVWKQATVFVNVGGVWKNG